MVYGSLKYPTPGKNNFDFRFRNPTKFKVKAISHSFYYQFFYLNFESSSDSKIQIKVQFREKAEQIL